MTQNELIAKINTSSTVARKEDAQEIKILFLINQWAQIYCFLIEKTSF